MSIFADCLLLYYFIGCFAVVFFINFHIAILKKLRKANCDEEAKIQIGKRTESFGGKVYLFCVTIFFFHFLLTSIIWLFSIVRENK